MRGRLGVLLILAGLAVVAWPIIAWAYGVFWQERLARSIPDTMSETGGPVPRLTTAVAPAELPPAPASRPKVATVFKPVPALRRVKRRKVRRGRAFARLRIERIGLNAIVVEGDSNVELRRGPGHLPHTGHPGEDRNCVIAAHRDAWFARLPELRLGDTVLVRTPDARYEYEVVERRTVKPNRTDLLHRGAQPMLTLVTCTGPGYPRSKYRLLVFCRLRDRASGRDRKVLVSSAATRVLPTGRPTPLPADEQWLVHLPALWLMARAESEPPAIRGQTGVSGH